MDQATLQAITQYGLPLVLLMMLLYSLRQFLLWVAQQYEWWKKDIVVPVTAKHMAFMDSASRTAETNAETLKSMHEQNKLRDQRDDDIHERLNKLQCLQNGRMQ